jgi:hypothetical protein
MRQKSQSWGFAKDVKADRLVKLYAASSSAAFHCEIGKWRTMPPGVKPDAE